VGERGLAKGAFEVRLRESGETRMAPVEDAIEAICAELAEQRRACRPEDES